MPSVAQKLCHDIVEPSIKRSTNAGRVKSSGKFSNSSSAPKRNCKQARYIHIDNQTSSKTKKVHTGGVTIIKSKTSVLKSLAETAVNTNVTGPLKCDNNCVTLVRKRNNDSSCKCGQKRPATKASSKCIQTLKKDFSHSDKACIHFVETASCGTQFLDKYSNAVGHKKVESKSNTGLGARRESKIERCSNIKRDFCQHNFDYMNSIPYLRLVTAKRWALSNYPTRGPDF